MKIRLFAALLIALLSLSLLTGCDLGNPEAQTINNKKINLSVEKIPAKPVDDPVVVFAQNEEQPATQPPATQSQEPTAAERLTPEQVKEIALTHAGLKADQVTRLRAEFDYDDGVPEYEVEFYHDGTEYDYEIHAKTGEILRFHKEKERTPNPQPTEPQPTNPQPTQPPATQPAEERLTAEQAKEIALKHAKLTADQVTRLRVEFDYDDGRPEYQVEFRHNGWEYDYEIHAQTGKILDWDKEFED